MNVVSGHAVRGPRALVRRLSSLVLVAGCCAALVAGCGSDEDDDYDDYDDSPTVEVPDSEAGDPIPSEVRATWYQLGEDRELTIASSSIQGRIGYHRMKLSEASVKSGSLGPIPLALRGVWKNDGRDTLLVISSNAIHGKVGYSRTHIAFIEGSYTDGVLKVTDGLHEYGKVSGTLEMVGTQLVMALKTVGRMGEDDIAGKFTRHGDAPKSETKLWRIVSGKDGGDEVRGTVELDDGTMTVSIAEYNSLGADVRGGMFSRTKPETEKAARPARVGASGGGSSGGSAAPSGPAPKTEFDALKQKSKRLSVTIDSIYNERFWFLDRKRNPCPDRDDDESDFMGQPPGDNEFQRKRNESKRAELKKKTAETIWNVELEDIWLGNYNFKKNIRRLNVRSTAYTFTGTAKTLCEDGDCEWELTPLGKSATRDALKIDVPIPADLAESIGDSTSAYKVTVLARVTGLHRHVKCVHDCLFGVCGSDYSGAGAKLKGKLVAVRVQVRGKTLYEKIYEKQKKK